MIAAIFLGMVFANIVGFSASADAGISVAGKKTASSSGCHAWPAANLQPAGRHRDHRSDVSGDGCGFNVDFYGLGGALRGRSTRASDADNLAPAMAYANPGPIRTDCGLSFTSTIAHCAPPMSYNWEGARNSALCVHFFHWRILAGGASHVCCSQTSFFRIGRFFDIFEKIRPIAAYLLIFRSKKARQLRGISVNPGVGRLTVSRPCHTNCENDFQY